MDPDFRARVQSGAPLAGTFLKTGSSDAVEICGRAGLDFAIIDAEHAPLGIETIDRLALAGHAARMPCLVRLPALQPGLCGRMLDLGVAGVVIPHVVDETVAAAAVAETLHTGGRRGFSPSTRAGGFGLHDAAGHAARSDAGRSLWCQIEDAAALDRLDAIAAVDGVDLLFIGRADLAVSLGVAGGDHPKVAEAVNAIAAAATRHGKPIGIYVNDMSETPPLLALGITIFACGSDQRFIALGAKSIASGKASLLG